MARLQEIGDEMVNPQSSLLDLSEAQITDLMITWQWMKSRMWRVASMHNLTSEAETNELSSSYVLGTACLTAQVCQHFSLKAIESHGTGFVSHEVHLCLR
jgi:hypothetical protein